MVRAASTTIRALFSEIKTSAEDLFQFGMELSVELPVEGWLLNLLNVETKGKLHCTERGAKVNLVVKPLGFLSRDLQR